MGVRMRVPMPAITAQIVHDAVCGLAERHITCGRRPDPLSEPRRMGLRRNPYDLRLAESF